MTARIADAACRGFQAGLDVAFQQATSAYHTVIGGLKAAQAGGVDLSVAGTAIGSGIESCLDTKLDAEVAGSLLSAMAGIAASGNARVGFAPSYSAYKQPLILEGYPELPDLDTDVCVSNCI